VLSAHTGVPLLVPLIIPKIVAYHPLHPPCRGDSILGTSDCGFTIIIEILQITSSR